MQSMAFDREVARLQAQLPAGPRLAILGSTSFWHAESEETCGALGRSLAGVHGLVLVTGGVEGAGESVGRSFLATRERIAADGRLYHVLPEGYSPRDFGETLFAGSDMGERREVLGRLVEAYVVIEGGPGTAHEAAVAMARPAVVIPVGRSGGCAAELYPKMARPAFADDRTWALLDDSSASAAQVAQAVTDLVRANRVMRPG